MAGTILSFPLPVVESMTRYAPASLARQILNLRLSPDGVLESVRGPVPLIPNYGAGYPYTGKMHGVFHALLDNGQRDVLLIRSGSVLYEQTGWTRSVASLQTGLSNDPHPRFPDQFVEVAGKVVWNNGVDTPLIYDGYTLLPLGYDRPPAPPTATGPSDTGHPVFRNQGGYSHPGKIGSQGDFYTAQNGALLPGIWTYYVQYEDFFGNRSPLSPASGPVVLRRELTTTSYWPDYNNYPDATEKELGLLSVNLDDLGRQFLVQDISIGPSGTVARNLYRTMDTNRNTNEPHFLARIPDNVTTVFPDDTADGMLGAVASDYTTVTRFSVMCEHLGALAVIEGKNLRISDPGFPGSFQRKRYVPIGSDGSEPTAVWSFNRDLYAATTTCIYRIEESPLGLHARAITQGIGVVGPEAVASTEFGMVGLSSNGFWRMTADSLPEPISRDLFPLFSKLRSSDLPLAVLKWSPLDRELLAALPYGGEVGNSRIFTWDGTGWKERQYGIGTSSMCVTRDTRQYAIIAGKRVAAEENVFVLHGEAGTYTPPTKTYRYRSQWLRADPAGMRRFDVTNVYVGLVESSKGNVTWTTWQNDSRDTSVATGTLEAMNPATTDRLDTLVLGTGKLHDPRLTWKKFGARIKSAESFAFDLECSEPTYLSIAAIMFEVDIVDDRGGRVSRQ